MSASICVLDHGYVKLIDHFGTDESIIEAARMSTNKGFEGWEKDFKLLAFLWENKHHTPFEMAGITIEVKAPIFVFREWHRHRTQSYNEMSARYVPLPNENYIPSISRLMLNGGSNKQAQGIMLPCNENQATNFIDELQQIYAMQQELYESALARGIPKELARIHLPVGRYSRMRASCNLRNWFHFLSLRMADNAQWEIRQYANAVAEFVKELFPKSYYLFDIHGE